MTDPRRPPLPTEPQPYLDALAVVRNWLAYWDALPPCARADVYARYGVRRRSRRGRAPLAWLTDKTQLGKTVIINCRQKSPRAD